MVVTTLTKRAHIVQLRELNWTFDQIGKKLSFDKSTAMHVHHKYSQHRNWYLREPRRGRPKKLSIHNAQVAVRRI